MDYSGRVKALQKQLRRKKIDAILVSQPSNRRYLSGFTASDHDITESSGVLLIPARGKGLLLTDFRYMQQAENDVDGLKVKIYTRGLLALLKKLLPKMEIQRLAFETDYLLHSSYVSYGKAFKKIGVSLIPLSGVIEKMREVKDGDEIDAIRKSVRLNEQVFQEVFPKISSSMSEIEVALAIEQTMRKLGAESASFDSIVASGDNSALPHAVPSRQMVMKDRPLTIDMGLVLKGYCSDMTRTFVPGKASKKYKKIHRIVREAQRAGIAAIRPGITGKEADKAARDVIDNAGYGKYFGHSLGHGVGLQVHEAPRLSKMGNQKLKPGMIVTAEPGIYIPGWGGIRLENMLLVTDDGCEDLNSDATWLDI